MRKIVIPVLSLLLLLPLVANGADDAVFSDTNVDVGGYTLVVSGTVDQMVVGANSVTFSLSSGSSLVVQSNNRKALGTTPTADVVCTASYSRINVSGNSIGSTLKVTPTDAVCGSTGGGGGSSGGGGGGGTATPTTTTEETTSTTMPETTTGEVTATASGGGKTTLTTGENTTAAAELPADAVDASTDVKVESKAKDTITNSRPTPSGRSVVGTYVYDFTATASGEAVSSFDQTVTLTFTYTDSQIEGLDESILRVFYWKESTSQWVALPTTVDETNNSLTATTDHFTYFAVMGREEGEEEDLTEETPSTEITVVDGDLIRNPNAEGMAQFDIYIVKVVGSSKFKRLILSPHVFESYEHFDKDGDGSPWNDVLDVNQSKMDEYTTSDLVRATGEDEVYKLIANGDSGTKQWLNMTAAEFTAGGYDADSIYEINATDKNAYTTGTDITG